MGLEVPEAWASAELLGGLRSSSQWTLSASTLLSLAPDPLLWKRVWHLLFRLLHMLPTFFINRSLSDLRGALFNGSLSAENGYEEEKAGGRAESPWRTAPIHSHPTEPSRRISQLHFKEY